jgi:hypothetical protein
LGNIYQEARYVNGSGELVAFEHQEVCNAHRLEPASEWDWSNQEGRVADDEIGSSSRVRVLGLVSV